jgi:CheY-like chemotaxis protein
MDSRELPRVLCVDDEPRVLDGLALHLRREYQVFTADGAQSALKMLEQMPAPAVVLSDMRMPGMDGTAFLKEVRHMLPDTTRILLTGDTGRDAAIAAINEGRIFRFLTKPCAPGPLKSAIEDGVAQHRLMVAEKVLLQETLIGCIKALIEVLAITNPVAFSRTNRVTRMAMALAAACELRGFWPLEAAAMLSQIGYISLPAELVDKLLYGERLSPTERTLTDAAPQLAQSLLGNIPRLEPVMEILGAANGTDAASGSIKLAAGILRLTLDFDRLTARGNAVARAIDSLRGGLESRHDKALIDALAALVGATAVPTEIIDMAVGQVKPGMVILDDLRTHGGTLLVSQGFEVTEAFLEGRRQFGPDILNEKVRVRVGAA